MDTGTLIFYLIIIFFIISRIRRAIKEGEKVSAKKPKQNSSWENEPSDVMAEILQDMEEERYSTNGGPVSKEEKNGRDDIIFAEYTRVRTEPSPGHKEVSRPSDQRRAKQKAVKADERRLQITERRLRKSEMYENLGVAQSLPSENAAFFGRVSPSLQQQLQAAVVWSEILAPPLALRDMDI